MISLEEITESNDYGYFKKTTNVPDYDLILHNKTQELPSKYRDWVGRVKWFTKEKYFKESSKLQGTDYSEQFDYIVPEKVDEIEDKMSNGIHYDLPYLNYNENTQEGRHRVIAADRLGQNLIPVLILTKRESVKNRISTMIGKWDDLIEKNGDYYCLFDDISDLLGSIVPNYDDYLLDEIFSIYFRGIDLKDYIKKESLNYSRIYKNGVPYGWNLRPKPNYNGSKNVDEKTLYWSVIMKLIKNNVIVIEDSVLKIEGKYHLKVVENFGPYLNDYDRCKDMFNDLSKNDEKFYKKFYVNEYNLLSLDEKNTHYELSDDDINPIIEILSEGHLNEEIIKIKVMMGLNITD
jgi:hypothetical protein